MYVNAIPYYTWTLARVYLNPGIPQEPVVHHQTWGLPSHREGDGGFEIQDVCIDLIQTKLYNFKAPQSITTQHVAYRFVIAPRD